MPVASSAFWQRTVGKPMPSSCASASALNSGNAGAAACTLSDITLEGEDRGRTGRVLRESLLAGLQARAVVRVEREDVVVGEDDGDV